MGLWNKTTKLITGNEPKRVKRNKYTSRDLIRMESAIGASLFGSIPAGHRREFFYLDNQTWVWYEEWQQNGAMRQMTTRYEVHPNGVLKVQDGQPYAVVEGEELKNLLMATRSYYQRTSREVYNRDPATRRPLAV
ncbi:MAG: hypothetical protein PVI21_06505 [Candidatus Woesebacteria bacterium]|jgi:hypothetical protein